MCCRYYTNRRSSLLSDVFKGRQFSQETKARYTLWHDIAIATRISMIWVIFLIAYVFTFVDYRAALGVLFGLALCAPLYGYAERRLLGLNLPVTQFLEHEVGVLVEYDCGTIYSGDSLCLKEHSAVDSD